MDLQEALAVVMYLKDVPTGTRNEKVYAQAWFVICEELRRIEGRLGVRFVQTDD